MRVTGQRHWLVGRERRVMIIIVMMMMMMVIRMIQMIVTIIGDAHQNDYSMILKYPFQGGKEGTKKKTSKPWKALADPGRPWEGNRCGH